MKFSTLNESSLHRTLKQLYCTASGGNTEVAQDGFVYDIVSADNSIIEIQTKNLSKLLPKIQNALHGGRRITVVHPIAAVKTIELKAADGTVLSRRKSPVKGCIHDIFRELTGIYPVLLHPDFVLEIPELELTEERLRTELPVQSRNGRRRFKKDWIKTGKRLDAILRTTCFTTKDDYLALLPAGLPEEFSVKDVKAALKSAHVPARSCNNAGLMLWVLSRMRLISETGTKGRSKYYTVSPL